MTTGDGRERLNLDEKTRVVEKMTALTQPSPGKCQSQFASELPIVGNHKRLLASDRKHIRGDRSVKLLLSYEIHSRREVNLGFEHYTEEGIWLCSQCKH